MAQNITTSNLRRLASFTVASRPGACRGPWRPRCQRPCRSLRCSTHDALRPA
jgi:hypothetical protein